MLYIGYLIILDGQSIIKMSFGKFAFLSFRGAKTALAGCAPNPLEPPPPLPTPE